MSNRGALSSPPSEGRRARTDAQRSESSKLLLSVPEAAARLGIGRTLMYQLISTGAVRSVLVGRLRRIRPEDLASYAASLADASAEPSSPTAA